MDYNYENQKPNKKKLLRNILPKSGSYDFNNASLHEKGTIKLTKSKIQQTNRKMSQVLTKIPESRFDLNTSFFGKIFPKYKRSLVGIPLLCLAYFSAVITLLSYGMVSVLSIYQIVYGDLANVYPLFLLVIGYVSMALLSFLLIIAIFKEKLNFVACWIIVISVFILPEIGLNILLANNSLNWFNTQTGFYTLVILIIRISFDLPCIFFILIYHINLTKKNIYLKNIMMPLKDSIVNGDVLKIYNSIKIDNFELPSDVYQSLPEPVAHDSQDGNYGKKSNEFEKYPIKNGNLNTKNSNQKLNTYFYRLSPNTNYAIQLTKSQTDSPNVKPLVEQKNDAIQTHNSFHQHYDIINKNKNFNLNALHLVWDVNNQQSNYQSGNDSNFLNKSNSSSNHKDVSNIDNFEYLRRMQQECNHLKEAESNPIFKIPISADSHRYKENKIEKSVVRINTTDYSQKYQIRSFPAYESYNPNETVIEHHNNQSNNKAISLANHHIYLPPPMTSQGLENNYVKIARSFQI